MKRLYYCNAKYDRSTLISYNTEIIKFHDNICTLRVYHSMTTYMHIRKYIGRLYEIGEPRKAHIVHELYKAMLIYRQAKFIRYDLIAGVSVVVR